MTTITLAQIVDAVEATLGAAAEVARSQSYDELTEAVNEHKVLQVYPDGANQDAATATDRTTFQAKVRQTNIVVLADYYARQRSHIGEDMAALVTGIDSLTNILEAQNTKPYFGLEGIQAFSWSWQRVIFNYAGVDYIGARFTLNIRVF